MNIYKITIKKTFSYKDVSAISLLSRLHMHARTHAHMHAHILIIIIIEKPKNMFIFDKKTNT